MKRKPLPKELFVFRANEGEGEGNEYLSLSEDLAGTAELQEVRLVGHYKLAETMNVSTTIIKTIIKTKARKA